MHSDIKGGAFSRWGRAPIALARNSLRRARSAALFLMPTEWRGSVAATLPAFLLPPEMRADHFDHFFDEGDPYGIDENPDEQLKFARTLEVCGQGQLGRVLEIGSAVGSFTELLAPRATEVLALDVSPAAIAKIARRLHGHPNVRPVMMTIPAEFPDGPFDLIVASDILYYLRYEQLLRSQQKIEAALAKGGAFVAVHYVPRMGSVLDGDEAHDILTGHTKLRHVLSERTEFGRGRTYRIDRYENVGL